VHYVAHHRPEVPPEQLARIEAFPFGEVEPTDQELQGPNVVLARIRSSVETQLGPDRLATWTSWGLDSEALSLGLKGRHSEKRQSEVHENTGDLLGILDAIEPDALPYIKMVVEQDHGEVRQWGQQALRIPGWDRGLWVPVLRALIQWCKGMYRRSVAMTLHLLGPAAAAAWPTLLELANSRENLP
jgi:hypothetical protein